MSRKRKKPTEPGAIYRSSETGEYVVINRYGEEEPWEPEPYEMFPEPPEPDSLDDIPRRADGSVAPFYDLDHEQLERLGQDTPRTARTRHDGWTIARQRDFIEQLAATASIADACRYVGLSRQSAHKLYNRSPQFRAAWDEALKASINVLKATAFDRAVNGTQEQVWHEGRMVGFKEKHHDQLLIYMLRVRDPLNFAPVGDLAAWQRHRALEQRPDGIAPALERLEAAERAWEQAATEPPQLTAPADHLDPPRLETGEPGRSDTRPVLAAPEAAPPTASTSSTSHAAEPLPPTPGTASTSSTSRPPDPPIEVLNGACSGRNGNPPLDVQVAPHTACKHTCPSAPQDRATSSVGGGAA